MKYGFMIYWTNHNVRFSLVPVILLDWFAIYNISTFRWRVSRITYFNVNTLTHKKRYILISSAASLEYEFLKVTVDGITKAKQTFLNPCSKNKKSFSLKVIAAYLNILWTSFTTSFSKDAWKYCEENDAKPSKSVTNSNQRKHY